MNKSDTIISLDFLAGVVSCHGSFLWVRQGIREIPVFQIKLEADQMPLLEQLGQKLSLSANIYQYTNNGRHFCLFLVRKRSDIETKLIPAIDGRLIGQKSDAFEAWKKRYYEYCASLFYRRHSR